MPINDLIKVILGGGAIAGVLVALINAIFQNYSQRKTHREGIDDKLLDWWKEKADQLETERNDQINGLRSSFEARLDREKEVHQHQIEAMEQSILAQRSTTDMIISSLQTEIKRVIEQRGEDRLEYERKLNAMREDIVAKEAAMLADKLGFMQNYTDRMEALVLRVSNKGETDEPTASQTS